MEKQKERAARQVAWYPTIEQQKKIMELKKQLNTDLMQPAIGEFYNRTFPGKSWV
jgi:hypothetical protein